MSEPIYNFPFGKVTDVGFVPTSHDAGMDEIKDGWGTLVNLKKTSAWNEPDFYVYAEKVLGEDAAQLIDPRQTNPATLDRKIYVVKRFPDRRRRRSKLSFSHHSAVAGLMNEGDDALTFAWELLDEAVKQKLPSSWVEEQVRLRRKDEGKGKGGKDEVAFDTGTPLERLENLAKKTDKVLKVLPSGWKVEKNLLLQAKTLIDDAAASARNREAGGGAALAAEDLFDAVSADMVEEAA